TAVTTSRSGLPVTGYGAVSPNENRNRKAWAAPGSLGSKQACTGMLNVRLVSKTRNCETDGLIHVVPPSRLTETRNCSGEELVTLVTRGVSQIVTVCAVL